MGVWKAADYSTKILLTESCSKPRPYVSKTLALGPKEVKDDFTIARCSAVCDAAAAFSVRETDLIAAASRMDKYGRT
jgi:hypothetical protein